jgi:hypothetical protein
MGVARSIMALYWPGMPLGESDTRAKLIDPALHAKERLFAA